MKLKSGKEEIVYLLSKVIERYESQTGQPVIRNSNRKNYEGVARALSEISNQLPHTAESLRHDPYSPDYNVKQADYPFRKYDVTGNQIKDAYFNQIVSNPRSFLIDACYIYLYGVGRKGFEENPTDESLLKNESGIDVKPAPVSDESPTLHKPEAEDHQTATMHRNRMPFYLASLFFTLFGFAAYKYLSTNSELKTLKQDMKILPYHVTQQEIDSLEGVWLCYTGSPQARSSDPNRYHLVVTNAIDVKYKDGYFTFNRYGASFDHIGYMQFEAPWMVSIHSYVKNDTDSIESPRHSLMRLDKEKTFVPVISASWNFDVGNRNSIIGIREVYIKQGKGGRIEEVINTRENASCHCKIIRWHQPNETIATFYLRNELLDTLSNEPLKKLLDENSILLRQPQDGLIRTSDTSEIKK